MLIFSQPQLSLRKICHCVGSFVGSFLYISYIHSFLYPLDADCWLAKHGWRSYACCSDMMWSFYISGRLRGITNTQHLRVLSVKKPISGWAVPPHVDSVLGQEQFVVTDLLWLARVWGNHLWGVLCRLLSKENYKTADWYRLNYVTKNPQNYNSI